MAHTPGPQCFDLVSDPGILSSRNCSLPVVGETDGRPYCKRHSPEAKARREAKSDAHWAAETARFNKRMADAAETQRRADCFPKLLEALEVVAPAFHNTATKMGCLAADSFATCDTTGCIAARAAIAEAKGE